MKSEKCWIMNYGLGKVNFATTILLFFCFQGLLYSDIGLTLGFSYTTWNIGKLGPSLTLESSTITIYNLGNAYCQVLVRATNSENWTLSSSPGYDQFQLQIKGGDIAAYQNLTTNFADTLLKQWFREGTDMQAWLKYYNPVDSSTDAVQHIYVIFHAGVEPGYTYNSAGDFYWRDVGAVSDPPESDWSGPYDSILPSSLWQYMTGTTVGWMSYQPTSLYTGTPWGFLSSINCPTCTTTTIGSCPICGQPLIRWHTMGTVSTVIATVRAGSGLVSDKITAPKPAGTLIYVTTTLSGTDTINTQATKLTPTPLTWSVSQPAGSISIYTRVSLSGTTASYIVGCSLCSIFNDFYFYVDGVKSTTSSTTRTVPSYSRIVILD